MKIKNALLIIDMQRYYLEATSPYCSYFSSMHPGCMDYILRRCKTMVIPNIARLRDHFHRRREPVIYLRLCGERPDRSDLHRFFRKTWQQGKDLGFEEIYPLAADPLAAVIPELAPAGHDLVITKTTFSPFTATDIYEELSALKIGRLVCTGLATSQCVETTARDASERGFDIVHVEDAQADYDEISHSSSLYSSQGVCGGLIMTTEEFLEMHHH